MTSTVQVEISPGELLDKITILEIKLERLTDRAKLVNVSRELDLLEAARAKAIPEDAEVERLFEELYGLNEALWEIEDDLRECEREGDFGPRFVALARSVYRTNDLRAEVKREINLTLGSSLIEEKSYTAY